jgi:hypothetical protein
MKKQFILILIFCISVAGSQLFGQQATMTVAPNSFLIGDQALLTLQLKVKKGQSVIWPVFADSTSTYKLDVVDWGVVDTLSSDTSKWTTYIQKLKITTFDTGNVVINPIFFYAPDSTLIATADSLRILVSTIPVDTTKAFMDIQGTLDEHIRFSELLPWLLLALGILLVIGFGIYAYIRYKRKKPIFALTKTKVLPPHIIALQSLSILKEKRLWQQGLVKEFYSELTDILRFYISQRFSIDAMEMLSSEILLRLEPLPEVNPELSKMRDLLTIADLVKFAKANPLPNENDFYLSFAVDFVQNTKVEEPKKEEIQQLTNNE